MCSEMSVLTDKSRYYEITVEGKIDESWSDWMSSLQLVAHKEDGGPYITILSGSLADQAALRGLLNRLWDLNLVLRCVQQVCPHPISETE